MSPLLDTQDRTLRQLLDAHAARQPEGWHYRNSPRGRGSRELFQYPAMMVSPMQGALLGAIAEARGDAGHALDCFAGSGTTMTEALRLGFHFSAVDINPLAVLLCLVKSTPVDDAQLARAGHEVVVAAAADPDGCDRDGAWVTKWFRSDASNHLACLARAIREQPDMTVRRVLWITLAEVVRVSGNFRLSTPKLQTRPAASLERPLDVIRSFERLVATNRTELAHHFDELKAAQPNDKVPQVDVVLGDMRTVELSCPPIDVLVTSPPYGDNHTTMPYGQHSFLPLKWIDLDDIDPRVNHALQARSKTLDTHSLGGSRRFDEERVATVSGRSRTLQRVMATLVGDREGWTRVAAFFADLDLAFERALAVCASDAHMAITIGDRTVKGRRVPNADILMEMLSAQGLREVARVRRPIGHGKRMPARNGYSRTIHDETVLVLRRVQ